MKLSFKTPAKINLGLHILGKRADGFHEMETILQMVSLYDQIDLELLPSGIELICDTPGIPSDDSNLAVRAALLLQKTCPGRRAGARITLEKHIPAGAGLGGGSGNAAGVLMGLNVLWDLKLKREELAPLAAQIGSDIPFFLSSPCALGTGRGEILTPIQTSKKYEVLIIFPGFSVSTAWVYGNLNLKLTRPGNNISILKKFLSQSDVARLGSGLQNDLESVVIERFPAIQAIKDQLLAHNAEGVLMSGSGSSVFGIFSNSQQAQAAYGSFEKEGWIRSLTENIIALSEFLPGKILNYP